MDNTGVPETVGVIDREQIMKMIPHRDPFLLIDKVVDVVKGQSAVGVLGVTPELYFFKGHFPRWPVMPGVLIIEAMAQTAAVLVVHSIGEMAAGKLVYFTSIDNARFRKPVVPGTTLELHVERIHSRGPVWKFSGRALVDSKMMAEATFAAMIMDNSIGTDV